MGKVNEKGRVFHIDIEHFRRYVLCSGGNGASEPGSIWWPQLAAPGTWA